MNLNEIVGGLIAQLIVILVMGILYFLVKENKKSPAKDIMFIDVDL